jgi:hypothetical protein
MGLLCSHSTIPVGWCFLLLFFLLFSYLLLPGIKSVPSQQVKHSTFKYWIHDSTFDKEDQIFGLASGVCITSMHLLFSVQQLLVSNKSSIIQHLPDLVP